MFPQIFLTTFRVRKQGWHYANKVTLISNIPGGIFLKTKYSFYKLYLTYIWFFGLKSTA